MTRRARVRLDSSGMEEVLKSGPVQAALRPLAETVASSVRNSRTVQDRGIAARVEIDEYVTDRAATAVTLTHPAGSGMQAKHGIFSKAASQAGLQYRERG